jgi:hypothetical protein
MKKSLLSLVACSVLATSLSATVSTGDSVCGETVIGDWGGRGDTSAFYSDCTSVDVARFMFYMNGGTLSLSAGMNTDLTPSPTTDNAVVLGSNHLTIIKEEATCSTTAPSWSNDNTIEANTHYCGYLTFNNDNSSNVALLVFSGTTNANGDGWQTGATITSYSADTPPTASNVTIQVNSQDVTTADPSTQLTASYTYADDDSDVENGTTFKWYANDVEISGETSSTFTPDSSYDGKTIKAEVTPKNANGSGTAVKSAGVSIGSDNSNSTTSDSSTPSAPVVPVDLVIDFSDVNNKNGDQNYEITIKNDTLDEIVDSDSSKVIKQKAYAVSNSVKSQTTLDIPTGEDEKPITAVVELTDEKKTTLNIDNRDAKVLFNEKGGLVSTVETEEINSEIVLNPDSGANAKLTTKEKVEINLAIPENSEITQDESGNIASTCPLTIETSADTKDVTVEMTADTTAKIKVSDGVEFNYELALRDGIRSGELSLIKSRARANSLYSAISSDFLKNKGRFTLSERSKREVISANEIEIKVTSSWAEFDERQYFNGRRTIKLIIGSADITIDGKTISMPQGVEYELQEGSEIETTTTVAETSPYSLNVTSGWSLLASVVNSTVYIPTTFRNNSVSYKFDTDSGSWIKEPTHLEPNEGLWVKYDTEGEVLFDEYESSYKFDSTTLKDGWNLVGTGEEFTTTGLDDVWLFDNTNKYWIENPASIPAGTGFWVKR